MLYLDIEQGEVGEDIYPAGTVSKKYFCARWMPINLLSPEILKFIIDRYKADCETIQAKLCSDATDNELEKNV